jgi:hypothetical protein
MEVNMSRRSSMSLAASLLLLVALQRPLFASPEDEIWTIYYDSNCAEVGYRVITCFSHVLTNGQQSGEYKLVERYDCDTGQLVASNWYYWDGSDWVWFSGPPPCW